jgi:hydrogenase maturation protein HypF
MIRRRRYRFLGTVQGVGFRPFLYRLATEDGLVGWVQNRHDGVLAEVEGPEEAVNRFPGAVAAQLPPLARIAFWEGEDVKPCGEQGFRIVPSADGGEGTVHISPDAATCPDCLGELFAPRNRRYRYPFINCTNCGPRLTIINDIPYDRIHTSMASFPLCPDCAAEYENPADRRFHAEPNACPVCGPQVILLDAGGEILAHIDPIAEAVARLKEGQILAIKGLGGFHLAVDGTNNAAVRRLRTRKCREEKPLAIMIRDMEIVETIAEINDIEKALLAAPERPIVLVHRREAADIACEVAPGSPNLGIMLPYTPLHHLLMKDQFTALVMTSANQTDEPICIENAEAVSRLAGVADGFLVHNRDILVRCDDSIAVVTGGIPQVLRRARGFVPRPLFLHRSFPPVLALGAHLKSTICIVKDNTAFLSPHIGDLETPQARDYFDASVPLMERITESRPEFVACDLHPDFYSTRAARQRGGPVIPVQHHHAHIVSCMAEHGLSGKVIGLSMDGTGYGTDGQVWGGEFFVADERSFTRRGHFTYFPLPGGDKAIREPWRTAAGLLRQAYGKEWPAVATALALLPEPCPADFLEGMMSGGVQSPRCSSLGRIFDGVAAILNIRRRVTFEGQAAIELEHLAAGRSGRILSYAVRKDAEPFLLDPAILVRAIVAGFLSGRDPRDLAADFHVTIVQALAEMAGLIREKTGTLDRVVLSGGCFQNRLLLEGCVTSLKARLFNVFFHQLVPTNDGGISLGQAVCAGTIISDPQARE